MLESHGADVRVRGVEVVNHNLPLEEPLRPGILPTVTETLWTSIGSERAELRISGHGAQAARGLGRLEEDAPCAGGLWGSYQGWPSGSETCKCGVFVGAREIARIAFV